ncbi:SVM family protein, partial [Candidatus Phytoplasma citri]
MFKIKNNVLLLNLFVFLGLFLLITNNQQVMGMHNNYASENNSIVNNHIDEHHSFRNLLLTQRRISQQLINA